MNFNLSIPTQNTQIQELGTSGLPVCLSLSLSLSHCLSVSLSLRPPASSFTAMRAPVCGQGPW